MSLLTIDGVKYDIRVATKRAVLTAGNTKFANVYLNQTPPNAWDLQLETSNSIIPYSFFMLAKDQVTGAPVGSSLWYFKFNIQNVGGVVPLFDQYYSFIPQDVMNLVGSSTNSVALKALSIQEVQPYSSMFQQLNSAYTIYFGSDPRALIDQTDMGGITAGGNDADTITVFSYLELT